ncbi:VirB8/TrbF family protein [[Mycobacterium] nativiensis]|uniref:VirB8/TrbF family protein n=1 Tax=[Mycobacterium] nativiensis TaxID=2855503 RepID=A0ABU5XQW0_9MYCO|nr:VirB8/TrbF family protein [Mycolicibacter sp. MYC340]MEB3030325.1 VirB8/TrbF family protein [Mycolicibacter sp. MYC340]
MSKTGTLVALAEAEAAEAEAVATEARARAVRLQEEAENADADGGGQSRSDHGAVDPGVSRLARVRDLVPGWRRLAAVAVVVCSCALLALSALMIRQHRHVQADQRQRAEFVAVARQVVVTLMSIDYNDAEGAVQRIVDNSTGPFRTEFQGAAEDFVKVSKDAKVTTQATVNAAAVESMTPDSAVVLVAASSTVTNAAGAEDAPRRWRLTVDLQREGDQIKMSKVEFVP